MSYPRPKGYQKDSTLLGVLALVQMSQFAIATNYGAPVWACVVFGVCAFVCAVAYLWSVFND